MLVVLLCTALLTLLSVLLWRRKQQMGLLQALGIDGPTPNIIFGNYWQIRNGGYHAFVTKYTKIYGKQWGYYEGAMPILVTSDANSVKQVLIKDFNKFVARKRPLFRPNNNFVSMFSARGIAQWKRLRSIGGPSFTAKRMKEMSPLINSCIDSLMDLFAERCDKGAFNIHGDMQKLTLDTIASCAFGIDTNSIRNPQSEFLLRNRALFDSFSNGSLLSVRYGVPLFAAFPNLFQLLHPLLSRMFKTSFSNNRWLLEQAKDIIQLRRENKSDRVDFINLMLKANAGKHGSHSDVLEMSINNDTAKQQDKLEENAAPAKVYRSLTMEEMQSNCVVFILAGFETTSTALGFAAYQMAINPDIQAKLQEEIDANFVDEDCRPDYLAVQKLPYMDMFFNEILRMYEIGAFVTNRECNEACRLGDKELPVGLVVQVNMEALHHDPDHWGPEPVDRCVPERFLPERVEARHPSAFMPFGGGPRNCVGMRFALMEAKVALVRVLKRYKLESCAETAVPLKLSGNGIRGPAEGVFVRLARRS